MVLAAVVGLGAGLAAVGFSTLVELSDHFFFDILKDDWLGGLPNARLILIPAIGGLLVGPITYILAPGARGHSVPEVMVALDSRGGRLPATSAVGKIVAATLTIGSGGSVGRQGPVVFLGAAFGSLAGRILQLNEQTMRLLAAAGAAGGVAAISTRRSPGCSSRSRCCCGASARATSAWSCSLPSSRRSPRSRCAATNWRSPCRRTST